MPEKQSKQTQIEQPSELADALLDIVRELAIELHPHKKEAVQASLDSLLERELGLDSLGRVELLLRIERAFDVQLSGQLLALAETPRDLLRGIQEASPTGQPLLIKEAKSGVVEEVKAIPEKASTLLEVLSWHVQTHPQRLHISLYKEDNQEEEITYGALQEGAEAIAAGLQAQDIEPGQTVGIMLPTSRDFFISFYGVLLAGGIPVPLYPPMRLAQLEEHLLRQAGILSNALASLLITVPEALPLASFLKAQVKSLRVVTTVSELSESGAKYRDTSVQAQHIALLQYTSGSTGHPKGVILTHANLLANIRAMGKVTQTTSRDVFVSWLPLYHDMGLIGAWLGSLYHACPLVLMAPLTFLARPARWLWAIHRHGGTLSAAPNFGYELCLRKIRDREIEGLSLHSWRMACNGAEPVSPDTITRFCERFAPYGFRREAMAPVYGLAESSVGLAFPPPERGPMIDRIQREPFLRFGQAIPAAADDPNVLRFVACGQPLPGHQIRIVDTTGYEVAERQEGRLEFRGPSVTTGYFRNPEETRRLFHGEWLDSGDLAYIAEGEVYLTGRVKDIIIRAGRNIYPHELEEAIGDIPGIRKGCVAVFGSADPVAGTERLVVLAETRQKEPTTLEQLRQQIEGVVVDLVGMPPDDVVLAPSGLVLKTSSGKIRRAASRELYERGGPRKRHRSAWEQYIHLTLVGIIPQIRRTMRGTTDILYAGYFWMLVGILAPLVWVTTAVLPRMRWNQTILQTVARLFFWCSRIPVLVQGSEQIPSHGPWVFVTNHASYMDGLVLATALPTPVRYVAKRELVDQFIPRVFLQRIGTVFVERFDPQCGLEDTERVLRTVREGHSVVFFPEGTFERMPGLRPFRMGAFVVAAQAGVPVIPVAIRGTRSLLRAYQWLPRRGTVRITIGKALLPQGTDWKAALELREAARAQILRYCGEPDLAPEIESKM